MRNGRVNRLIGETGKIVMSVNRIKTIIETFLGSDMPGEVQQRFAEWLRDPASRDEKERALENYWNGLRAEEPGGRERKLERLHEAMRRGERFRVRRIWRNVAAAAAVVLLAAGWRWQARWNVRQDWKTILGLAVVVCALTQAVYIATAKLYGPENSIHIEVLLPAFVVGMLMKHKHIDTPTEQRVSTGISFLFMLLVGLSMPLVTGAPADTAAAASVTGSQPMMPWGTLLLHVVTVSVLSNLGKLVPLFFYRDRKVSERLALSIGMFTRGEVGAGVIFIALGYSLGGPALIISVLTLVLNLILTGGFVVWVKKLALRSYTPEPEA